MTDFRVEGTNFDEPTQTRINRIADITADTVGAKMAGVSYRELQQLEAMKDAANNESGAAGVFMGMGAGMGLSNTMNEVITPQTPAKEDVTTRLSKLKALFESALITQEEYAQKKSEVLKDL